jgi:hypothetical protein
MEKWPFETLARQSVRNCLAPASRHPARNVREGSNQTVPLPKLRTPAPPPRAKNHRIATHATAPGTTAPSATPISARPFARTPLAILADNLHDPAVLFCSLSVHPRPPPLVIEILHRPWLTLFASGPAASPTNPPVPACATGLPEPFASATRLLPTVSPHALGLCSKGMAGPFVLLRAVFPTQARLRQSRSQR